MRRMVKYGLMTLVVAGFLGGASAVLAAPDLECAVTKDGKTTKQMVQHDWECTKLGGKIVKPDAPAKKKD